MERVAAQKKYFSLFRQKKNDLNKFMGCFEDVIILFREFLECVDDVSIEIGIDGIRIGRI